MKKWLDIFTVAIAAIIFLIMALGLVIPWRKPDSLTVALCGLLLTWGVIFTLSLLQLLDWLPLLLPAWEGWLIRGALDLFGVLGIVQMFRRGVFRREPLP